MSDAINLLNNVSQLDVSPLANGYTKVIINAGTDENGNVIAYQSGSDGGAVLTIDNPWGTQTMADNMLAQLSGYQYQPYSASGAILDPSAELGDGVTIAGTYGGLFSKTTSFTSLMKSDISAPGSEEIEHEQTSAVESATDRAYSRLVKSVNSRITQTATQIALEVQQRTAADDNLSSQIQVNATNITAKVSKESTNGSGSSTFGWSLEDNRWRLFNNSGDVLVATSNGLEVKGKITATSGEIGGYTINNGYLSYGGMTWESNANSGIYIGTSGIKLGQNVKISSSGYMELKGKLKLNDVEIKTSDLRTGAEGGNNWTSNSPTVFTGVDNGNDAHTIAYTSSGTKTVSTNVLSASTFTINSTNFTMLKSNQSSYGTCYLDSIKDYNGETQYVVKWR